MADLSEFKIFRLRRAIIQENMIFKTEIFENILNWGFRGWFERFWLFVQQNECFSLLKQQFPDKIPT